MEMDHPSSGFMTHISMRRKFLEAVFKFMDSNL
jgi:hypothetical protein